MIEQKKKLKSGVGDEKGLASKEMGISVARFSEKTLRNQASIPFVWGGLS